MGIVRKSIFWFVGLIFLQVTVLNNLDAGKWFFAYAYVLFILMLPRNIPHWLLLLIAFALGSIVDLYTQTYGTHAFATTLVAFLRPNLLNSIAPSDSSTDSSFITVHLLGFQKFAVYASIMTLTHHLFVFFIDEFSFVSFFIVIGQVISSTVVSLFAIFCLQFIFNKKGG